MPDHKYSGTHKNRGSLEHDSEMKVLFATIEGMREKAKIIVLKEWANLVLKGNRG